MLETIMGAAVETVANADDRREWAVSRPSRSVSAVRDASAVPANLRAFASCVVDRESGGTLERTQSGAGAMNTGGSGAAGRWQFMPAWRNGLPYMIKDRLVQFGASKAQAKAVRVYLSRVHYIHLYPGIYQDIGFLEVVERGGAFHWNGHTCGSYR